MENTSTGGAFLKKYCFAAFCGFCAGSLTGLFGTGGGMVLVPLMRKMVCLSDEELFPVSVATLLPICIVSLVFTTGWDAFSWSLALPYLLGSVSGGFCAGKWGQKIPSIWLHRILGILIIWGGIRYIC